MERELKQFWVIISLRISISIMLLGCLFKILHWPFSSELINSGCLLTILTYTGRFILKELKRFPDIVKLIFVILVCVRSIVIMNHLPFQELFWITISITQIFALIYLYFSGNLSSIPPKSNSLVLKSLMAFSGLFIIVGCLFKIMHWLGSHECLIMGFGLLICWLISEPFLKNVQPRKIQSEPILDDFEEDNPSTIQKFKSSNKNKSFHLMALTLTVLGLFFKLKHWPGSSILIFSGVCLGVIYIVLTLKD